jgi:DNA-binding LacI/PurR family transcriptional regulator
MSRRIVRAQLKGVVDTTPGAGVVVPAAGRPAGPAPRGLTLRDVARAAGVGKSTVSNVLNGTGRVGEAARIRVLETVEQLGYQPHQGARSMRSRRTMRLAYLMPPIQLQPTNLIMMTFLQALLTAAAAEHYRVLVVPQAEDPRDDIRRLVADRSVDAFVLSELEPGDTRAELLQRLGMPFVCFGRTDLGPPLAWVDIDDAAAEADAVAHVIGRGYRWPGYIGYAPRTYWDAEREAGFRTGLAATGVAQEGAGVLRLADDAMARACVCSFLTDAQPDAVLTGSDKIATIVYRVAADLNLRIGRDLAVVGFDGSVGAELLSPPLTSVVMPVEEVATRIVERVRRLIEHGWDDAPGEILSTWLREGTGPGGSSTAPRGAD